MGLFKKLKKAFKKVVKGVKKGIKKVVKGVKKVVKKIGSSKILKALAIAAAVVVTGGAALTAFGGTGALASSQLGSWMMTTSSNILGGSAFGSAAAKSGLSKFLTQTGNFLAKTAAKPFGAIGGAIGSTARLGANLAQGKDLLSAGPAGAGTSVTAPTPFSAEAFSGQNVVADSVYFDPVNQTYADKITGQALSAEEISRLPASFTGSIDITTGAARETFAQTHPRTSQFLTTVGTNVASSVATGYAMQQLAGDPELQGSMSGLRTEGATDFDPLRIYAAERGIADADISKYFTFSNTPEGGNMPLFSQETIGVA